MLRFACVFGLGAIIGAPSVQALPQDLVSTQAPTITSAPATSATASWESYGVFVNGSQSSVMTLEVVPWIDVETFGVMKGTTYSWITLTAGETEVVTFTRATGGTLVDAVSAVAQTAGRCKSSGLNGPSGNEAYTVLATYKSTTTLTDGQVLAWDTYARGLLSDFATPTTYTGPTVMEIKTTTPFFDEYIPDNARAAYIPFLPADDRSCKSACGACQFYYPEVTVRYWPEESANTACLGGNNASSPMTSAPIVPSGQPRIKYRALADRGVQNVTVTGNGTANPTMIVDNGVTYESPSVYVEFPTLFAWDHCGKLGPEPTNMVRSYNPAQMTTMVYDSTFGSHYSPFDFASAECPPQSIADNQFWVALAKDGRHYNPIISAPSDLTEIHPWWTSCVPGPFQGHDPPSALTPYNNLMPNPTPASDDPPVSAEPAEVTTSMPSETAAPFNPDVQPAMKIPSNPSPTTSPKEAASTPESSPDPSAQEQTDPSQESTPDPSEQNDPAPQGSTPEPTQESTPNTPQENTPAPSQDNTPDPSEVNDPNTPEENTPQQNTPQQNTPQQNNPSNNSPNPVSDPAKAPTPTPIHIDPASEQPSLQILGTTLHVKPSSNLVIDSQTLTPGGSIQVSGTPVIFSKPSPTNNPSDPADPVNPADPADPSNPQPAPQAPTLPAATVGSSIFTPNADSSFIVGTQSFAPGAVATVDGKTITLPTPQTPPTTPQAPTIPAATIGSTIITPNADSSFIIGTQTFAPGAVATIDGSTLTLPTAAPAGPNSGPTPQPLPLPPITLAGATYTPDASSHYIISGTTYAPGATVTVGGVVVTLPGAAPVSAPVGGTPVGGIPAGSIPTGGIPVGGVSAGSMEVPGVLTVGTQTYQADSAGGYVVGGQTLAPGGEITVGGTRVSLGARPTVAVVGTRTEGVGDVVMSGLGGGAVATGTGAGEGIAVGGVGRLGDGGRGWWMVGVGLVVVMGW